MGDENVLDQENELSSHEIMKWLNDVQRDRYVALQETFETTGWKLLVQYAQAKAFEAGVRGANAQSWEDNRRAYGERAVWDEVVNMAEQFMNEFAIAANAARMEATEAEVDNDTAFP